MGFIYSTAKKEKVDEIAFHRVFGILTGFFARFFFRLRYFRILNWRRRRAKYIYVLERNQRARRRNKSNTRFISVRLTRLYYFQFKDRQFRRLFKRATAMNGNMESNYLNLLENRLFSLIYRANFVRNMFGITDFIRKHKIYLDGSRIYSINTQIPISKFLYFDDITTTKLIKDYKIRLKLGTIRFNTPRYMFVSYKFLFLLLYRLPKKEDLYFPINVDIYRLTGYF